MTLAFDPLPTVDMESLADMTKTSVAQAAVIDANFAKIKNWYDGVQRSDGYNSRDLVGNGKQLPWGYTTLADVVTPVTFTVPQCFGVMVDAAASFAAYAPADTGIIYVQFTGPAISGPFLDVAKVWFQHASPGYWMSYGRHDFVPVSQLRPGSQVTATMWAQMYGSAGGFVTFPSMSIEVLR